MKSLIIMEDPWRKIVWKLMKNVLHFGKQLIAVSLALISYLTNRQKYTYFAKVFLFFLTSTYAYITCIALHCIAVGL
jgi:hypothetical protein